MADPAAPYVDPAELAKMLGVAADDPRLERVVTAVGAIVDGYYGDATVAASLVAPPWPAGVTEAALEIAIDVWRRPTAPGGYFQVADYVGRLSADPASSVVVLLDSAVPRLEWGVA